MRAGKSLRWRPIFGVVAAGVFTCSLTIHGAPPRQGQGGGELENAGALIRSGVKIRSDRIPRAEPVRAFFASTVLARDEVLIIGGGPPDANFGSIATPTTGAPTTCELDVECDDCNPCTADTCVITLGVGACTHPVLVKCEACDDGIFCNGKDRCDEFGVCVLAADLKSPPEDPCELQGDRICDEEPLGHLSDSPSCLQPCKVDADCDDDNVCTGSGLLGNDGLEFCTAKRCVGGTNEGNSCTDDAECDSNLCGGLCRSDGPRCGAGATCSTGTTGDFSSCGNGRCCDGAGVCSREERDNCTGRWLGLDGADTKTFCRGPLPSTEPNAGEDMQCPKYESGITEGNNVDILGPAAVDPCNAFREIGDDYQISNSPGAGDWYELTTFRWIGGFDAGLGSRMRISFYDLNHKLVVDTITGGSATSAIRLRTVIFGEKPVIPGQGYVTVKPAAEFSPANRTHWATTDAASIVGTNDNDNVYVDAGSGLVVTTAASLGLTSGTLAFELVGEKTGEPKGACCHPDTGVCEQKYPWECAEAGGSFQAIGVGCGLVCNVNPLVACETNQDCIDADAGTTCVLNPTAPACLKSACCDPVTGECGLAIGGGNCSVATGTICSSDVDCPFGSCSTAGTDCHFDSDCPQTETCVDPETCEANCPGRCATGNLNQDEYCNANGDCDLTTETDGAGTCDFSGASSMLAQGFGTSCVPNCCIQPSPHVMYENVYGNKWAPGDTCVEAEATRLDIIVPTPGEVATYTLTGNNKEATFGDYTDGSCDWTALDELGTTKDRGYWVAFSIDACADVRIENCCTKEITGDIHQPQWSFMMTSCANCDTSVGNAIVGELTNPPIGTPDAENDRGEPFCNSDDLWQTYRGLQPGTYWHPVYSGSRGHFGVFQEHIVVTGCPLAACCLPDGSATCVGAICTSGRVGVSCTVNVQCDTTLGSLDGTCGGAGIDDTCTRNSDCGDNNECQVGCQLLNQFECNDLGGYWNGFGNVEEPPGPTVTCDAGICRMGSCCGAPGVCQDASTEEGTCDRGSPTTCMDLDLCAVTGDGGTFVGGSFCGNPATPCPACSMAGEGNCQVDDLQALMTPQMSDLSALPAGVVVADDFKPTGTELSSVCVWGAYMDANETSGAIDYECSAAVEDNFRVRVYNDLGGFPGTLVGEGWANGDNVIKTELPSGSTYFNLQYDIKMWGYTLLITPPISPLSPTGSYWLEVANNTSHLVGSDPTDPTTAVPNTCHWHWAHISLENEESSGANSYSLMGSNGLMPEGQGRTTLGYLAPGSGRGQDYQFCLGTGALEPLDFAAPDTPVGCCCVCDGDPTMDLTMAECTRDLIGVWKQGVACTPADCQIQEGENCGICGLWEDGSCRTDEECAALAGTNSAIGGVAAGLDCTAEPAPVGAAIRVGQCGETERMFGFDTSCSLTDGPPKMSPGSFIVQDIWYEYRASCQGKLVISMCATGNANNGDNIGRPDPYLVIYHNGDDPEVCPCPGDNVTYMIADEDESCNGIYDTGPGIFVENGVQPGWCYTVRVGAWSDANAITTFSQGSGLIDFMCEYASSPATLNPFTVDSGHGTTSRFLSFLAGDAGQQQAIRVKFPLMPVQAGYVNYSAWDLLELWVGPATRYCENSGTAVAPAPGAPPNYGCDAAPGLPERTYMASTLQCDPHFQDWHGVCVGLICSAGMRDGRACTTDADCSAPINVFHEGILPSTGLHNVADFIPTTYTVQVIEESRDNTLEKSYSDPLEINTSKWGDSVLSTAFPPPVPPPPQTALRQFPPPEGIIQITDVLAILQKFQNLGTAPISVRVDLMGASAPKYLVDHGIDIGDVLQALFAFQAVKYPSPAIVGNDPNAPNVPTPRPCSAVASGGE